MIPRPKYKRLRKLVKAYVDNQIADGSSFIAVAKWNFRCIPVFSDRELDEAWPHIVKDLGLVDDGTGHDTYTLPGRGLMENIDELYRRVVKEKK